MKKTSTLSCIVAILGLCLLFTSCAKDEKIAMKLSGEWEGYWGMYYSDPELGEFDSYKSSVKFIPNEKYDTRGEGYQVDWYDKTPNAQGNVSPYERLSSYFTWEVINKTIYLTYPKHPNYNVRISDYELTKKHFTGRFNDSSTHFDLHNIWQLYKWSDYASLNTSYFLAWTWVGLDVASTIAYDSYYWTRDAANEETPIPMEDGHTIQMGNRFAE